LLFVYFYEFLLVSEKTRIAVAPRTYTNRARQYILEGNLS